MHRGDGVSLSRRARNAPGVPQTAVAQHHCTLAQLDRCDYEHLIKIDEMQSVVNQFWKLIRTTGQG